VKALFRAKSSQSTLLCILILFVFKVQCAQVCISLRFCSVTTRQPLLQAFAHPAALNSFINLIVVLVFLELIRFESIRQISELKGTHFSRELKLVALLRFISDLEFTEWVFFLAKRFVKSFFLSYLEVFLLILR